MSKCEYYCFLQDLSTRRYATANHAGDLLEQAMGMGKSIKTIMRQPPQIEGLDGGRTDVEPMTELIPELKAMEGENGILAVSLNAGFGLADVPFVGPSVTVTHEESALRGQRRLPEN